MYSQIVLPLDGQEFSARAIAPAVALARASDARLLVVAYAVSMEHVPGLRDSIDELAAGISDVDVVLKVDAATDIGEAIAQEVALEPGSLVCMSSAGRAHAAPILGSVADAVLRRVTTPVVLVGPAAEVDGFALEGPLTVCVDGSETSEAILPIVASWGIVFGLEIRVVSVQPPLPSGSEGESNYVHRVAEKLQKDVGRTVDFEVLHGDGAVAAVVADAIEHRASLVAAATHGVTGLRRLTMGSTTMGLVHRAHQPVLAYRPLDFLR